MGRRKFTREFKLEAVKLVTERGVTATQAAKDLSIGPNVVSRWVREARTGKQQAFPGHGVMRPDDAEVARLKRELAKVTAERDILKNVWSAPDEQGLFSISVASRFASMYPAY